MAPRQSQASQAKQQRAAAPKKSVALKTAVRQARRRVITKRFTKTGSKVVFKL